MLVNLYKKLWKGICICLCLYRVCAHGIGCFPNHVSSSSGALSLSLKSGRKLIYYWSLFVLNSFTRFLWVKNHLLFPLSLSLELLGHTDSTDRSIYTVHFNFVGVLSFRAGTLLFHLWFFFLSPLLHSRKQNFGLT